MAGGTGGGGDDDDDDDDDVGLTSCVSPGILDTRSDIERPAAGVLPPAEVAVEAAAVMTPAEVVVPVGELRGAIVFGVAVVIVVVAAVLVSASGAVAGTATMPVLLEMEVSLD